MGYEGKDSQKDHEEFYGHYQYKGDQEKMPYYEKVTPSSGSSSDSVVKPMFIFWDPKEEMWVFGTTLGQPKTAEFRSSKKNTGKCPCDPKWKLVAGSGNQPT